tara:strand:+ start:1815 stop:2168 length:354 start_codon:yes stop_codon:yes gene_type:complete
MIKCINRWFVLKPNDAMIKTTGGIIMPEEAVERNSRGIVVEIADKWMDAQGEVHQSDFAVGEELFYNKGRGVKIVEKDILAHYGIEGEEELIYLMFEDVYFISKENKEGKAKRKLIQ